MPIRKDTRKIVEGEREKNDESENSHRRKTSTTTTKQGKCSRATNEMISSQKNQTAKEAIRTSKKEKEEPTQ